MNELPPERSFEDTQEYNWLIAEELDEPTETFLNKPLSEVAVEPMSFMSRARDVGKEVFEVIRLAFDGEAH